MSAREGPKRCVVPTRLAVYPVPGGSVIVIPEAAEESKKCDELKFRTGDNVKRSPFCEEISLLTIFQNYEL